MLKILRVSSPFPFFLHRLQLLPIDQGDLAAQLSESDLLSGIYPVHVHICLSVSVAVARRMLLAWPLWAPVMHSLSQSCI